MSFACFLLDGTDIEWDDESDEYDEEFIDEEEKFAKQSYARFIGELFNHNGGQDFLIPCISQQTDASKAYHLQSKQWIDEEDGVNRTLEWYCFPK
ncbi:hypothetical protein C1X05_15190 [Laceyella sacchari]|nr:hypothetical protein C1X05_15190 [Laceyella sacchari]